MQIIIIKSQKIEKHIISSDNIEKYWIKDIDDNNNERELLLVEKIDNVLKFVSSENCFVENDGKRIKYSTISLNTFYSIKIVNNHNVTSDALIYVCKENDDSYNSYIISGNGNYTIGKNISQNIIINNEYIANDHAVLTKDDKGFSIKSCNDKYGVYVNDIKVSEKRLETGDRIFISGYKFIIIGDYIVVNDSCGVVKTNNINIVKRDLPKFEEKLLPTQEDDNSVLYEEDDYYSRQPRFVTSIIEEDMKIDSPPGKQPEDDTPVLYTVGPMLTMTMTSVVSMSTSISSLASGNGSKLKIISSIAIAVAMIASTLLWPSLLRKFNKKKQAKMELTRQKKYSDYLIEKKNKIATMKHNQHQILIDNYPEPRYLQSIILNKKRNLWERQIDSEDFLNVRVGIGTIPLKINLSYAVEDFSMSEDNLKEALTNVTDTAKDIPNCPVTISLTDRNKLVLVGDTKYKDDMLKSIILQLATYHAYNDLKLVFMINDTSNDMWDSFKILPHNWSNERDIRFFANKYEDMSKLSFYLEQVFTARKYTESDSGQQVANNITYRNVQPYYLIIVDNIKKNKNIEIINKILKEETNIGFGLIVLNDGIANLPNEISNFLSADAKTSAIITNDLLKKNQLTFTMDDMSEVNIPLMCEKISNIPIKSESVLGEMKSSLGFLEMYKVGKVEQLNIADRWKMNNPVNSLSVPIGIRADGEEFMLDLHEKFHGPHGLVAGMTGSGKSEFIITFILSMCLNFSPEEVSFVLIDYKGGGLTGAFENKLTGVKLPHLAGTITNLDRAEIKRSLSSIQSELKRRQELFNKAKMKLNESTLDIYKYQQLYRDGIIDEPVSHLFIVSDEFAELKSQQPEFMQELISTARIGRSLGVHLILATQKPSGVVDDQIWANSKFKVCLKVQERADSMDVIKCPDAVTLKKAGRFYLQVGYNDFFAMGQAAYAGTKYIPKEKITRIVNRDVSFLDNIGDTIRSFETTTRTEEESFGEELPNILKNICDIAKEKNLVARKLWLDKIPPEIFVTNLIRKYAYSPQPWNIQAVVGEYDDPNNQRQDLLILDFNTDGNTLIYGANGKEIMLSSIIYSLIINHSSDELNIYIIDFGSEMFGTFKNAPQVGDVVFINEQEKLTNLFNSLTKELDRRKKLFADYSGDYSLYIKNSSNTLPRIMIVINNYETLNESYDDFVDIISTLSREGEKYGIFFVMSVTGINGIRGKTAQNFSKQVCMQFNEASDYASILGPTKGMIPSNIDGRGLIKIDGSLYEFQTAYPYKWEDINKFIKNICSQLQEKVKKKAENIAVLPNHVRIQDIEKYITDIKNTPIGIVKDTLEVSTYDFEKNMISLISAQDITMLDKFICSVGNVFQNMYNVDLHFIDEGENIKNTSQFKNYYSSNTMDAYNKIVDIIKNPNEKINIFILYGIEGFINSLEVEAQRNFKELLVKNKDNKSIRFIIADSIGKIKMYEYEDFYRSCAQPINAIWLGSGITDQFTIKSSTYNKETRSQIPVDFGYNVQRGVARLVKLLDFFTEDE